jgi:rubredoxin
MSFFPCPRCSHVFDNQLSLNNHLNKKKQCKDIYNGYVCPFCKKRFEKNFILKRHIKEVCMRKMKENSSDENIFEKNSNSEENNNDEINNKEKYEQMMNLIYYLMNHIKNNDTGKNKFTQNNINATNTTNNTNQTINQFNCFFPNDTLPFGKEETSYITNKEIINWISKMEIEDIHCRLIDKLNFNPKNKKNQNVIKFPKHKNYFLVYEYDRKNKVYENNPLNMDDLTEKFIKRNIDVIDDRIDELKEANNPEILKIEDKVINYNKNTDKILNYLDNVYKDNYTKEKIKKIKTNVERMFLKKEANK